MTAALDPVGTHVAALALVLHGPGSLKRSMIAEVHDGLHDAATAYRAGGLDPHRAAATAVQDFGAVHEVAPQMQEELTARQGRSTALLLAVTFPGMVVGWDLLWMNGVSWPGPAPAVVAGLARVQDVTSAVIAMIALALVLVTFRRGAAPRLVTGLVGLTAAFGALVCGGTAVVMNVANAHGAADMLATRPLAVPAMLVSAVVLTLVVLSAVRALRAARAGGRLPSDQGSDAQVG